MFRRLASNNAPLVVFTASAAAVAATYGLAGGDTAVCAPYSGGKTTKCRVQDFPLAVHHHGKSKVRVLKVRHAAGSGCEGGEKHSVSEYTVQTRLYSPEYAKVFTGDDNTDIVATDTQKNTVYVVAKRTPAASPEQFGIDIARHFLTEYGDLTAVQVDVEEALWQRAVVDGKPHDHAFTKVSPERHCATVKVARGSEGRPQVTSAVRGMTILKTTQSGFSEHLKDEYTLLPDCEERCLATELSSEWSFNGHFVDYAKAREVIRERVVKGLFGPPSEGVFSVSLQATIYDAACLALSAVPELSSISVSTPNIHYLPTGHLLETMQVVPSGKGKHVRDVFVPTGEPSGSIFCEVKR